MKLSDFTRPFSTGRRASTTVDNDLGFGTQIGTTGGRLINRDGSYNIVRRGGSGWRPYESLVEMSWWNFLGLIILFYFIINAVFALAFLTIGIEHLSGIEATGQFWDNFTLAFFFSVQTFTTVGYGSISPIGAWANMVASIDALVGLLSFALATGLLFARFAKPQANIKFSNSALIRPYKDTSYQSLQFQIVNRRNNKIINIEAKVVLTWIEEGRSTRRFEMISLERHKIFLFPLNWVIVHVIDEESPLWKWNKADFQQKELEIISLLSGYDETFAQEVHANGSYTHDEIVWNRRFEPMYFSDEGKTVIDLDSIHDTIPLEEEE
jgi:inward rectifier potassium channel